MKFTFSYERLLEHRKRLEEMAQKDYLAAQKNVDEAKDELKNLYGQTDDARLKARQLEEQGGAQVGRISLINEFIIGNKVRIEMQKLKIRELSSLAEEKQQVLVVAAKEYKILLKLKEKRMEEHRRLLKKQEVKALDDLVVTRFKRGEFL